MRQHRYFPNPLYPVYSRFLRCTHGYILLAPAPRSGTWWLSHLHLRSTPPYAHERTDSSLSPAAHLPMPYFPKLSILPATSSSMPPLLFVYSSSAHLPFLHLFSAFILKPYPKSQCNYFATFIMEKPDRHVKQMYTRCHFSAQNVKNRKIDVKSARRLAKKRAPSLPRISRNRWGSPHRLDTNNYIHI